MRWSDLIEKPNNTLPALSLKSGEQALVAIAPGTPENPPFTKTQSRFGRDRYAWKVYVISEKNRAVQATLFLSRRAHNALLDLLDKFPSLVASKPGQSQHLLRVIRSGSGLDTQYLFVPELSQEVTLETLHF